MPHPPPQSHILEHSATASWAKTFLPAARGATLFCFLVLLMTFCRTDVDIMLNVVICQPASQPAREHTTSTSTRESTRSLCTPNCSQDSSTACLQFPLQFHSQATYMQAGNSQAGRQAGSQKYIPSTGITTKALLKKS